jgi:hypothetical protein
MQAFPRFRSKAALRAQKATTHLQEANLSEWVPLVKILCLSELAHFRRA